MMKYSNSLDEISTEEDHLPLMRPCSTATASRRVAFHGIAAKARGRQDHQPQSIFDDQAFLLLDENKSVASNVNSYISLGENTDEDTDTQTIHSSSLYSLHNYSPAATMKELADKKQGTYMGALLCPNLSLEEITAEVADTLENTINAFEQVLYAFVITPQDVDIVADVVQDAKEEMTEIAVDRAKRKLAKLQG